MHTDICIREQASAIMVTEKSSAGWEHWDAKSTAQSKSEGLSRREA